MNFFDLHITFLVFTALLLASRYADQWTSVRAPWYGTSEGNKLMRGKYGSFSPVKNYVGTGVVVAVGTLLHFLAPPDTHNGQGSAAYLAIYLPITGASIWIAIRNYLFQKKKRKTQIAFLRSLREVDAREHTPSEIAAVFNGLVLVKHLDSGRSRYELFGYIYTESAWADVARDDLQARIVVESRKPESQWFEGK